MDTQGRGEDSQIATDSQSRHKKGKLMNNCLTDSDEETIVDFDKDH